MNKKIIYTLTAFLGISLLVLNACKKDDKLQYSCNSEINTWAVKNQKSFANINHDEILQYELEYQKAIFRSITPFKRYQLWYDKFDKLSKLSWTEKEVQHIIDFRDNIQYYWFDNPQNRTKSTVNEMINYYSFWIEYAKNELFWSRNTIATMVSCLEIPIKNNKLLPFTNNNNYSKSDTDGNCQCATSSDWCDGFSGSDLGDCKSGGCRASSLGCGTGWGSSCNGLCTMGYSSVE